MSLKQKLLKDQIAAEEKRAKRERLEKIFDLQLRASGISGFVREHLFHHERKWRIDFALPDHKLAIEIEGGTWINGGHNRGKIYESNCEKYNALAAMGWTLFRFTTGMVISGKALLFVEDFLNATHSSN